MFGSLFDAERYEKGRPDLIQNDCMLTVIIQVIDQCGLRRDLELLDDGDLTEVGEKGLTLRCVLSAHAND